MIFIEGRHITTLQELRACFEKPEAKIPNSPLFNELMNCFMDGDFFVFLLEIGAKNLAKKIREIELGGSVVDMMNELRTEIMKPIDCFAYCVEGVEFLMKRVEGFFFQMGSAEADQEAFGNEKPMHLVVLSDYYIGETCVTQSLWRAVIGEKVSYNGWLDKFGRGDSYPAYNLYESDIYCFVSRLNEQFANKLPVGYKFALPTEAEWEYAARGGKRHNGYKFSGSDIIDEVGWYEGNSSGQTHPVKLKKANELELYDMSGNVWEMCRDTYYYDFYEECVYNAKRFKGASVNPFAKYKGIDYGFYKVVRGGSYQNSSSCCRIATRSNDGPYHFDSIGFRLALTL